jgi:hypothetical protein
MQVYGKTGYLGEYELSSIVSAQVANGRKEYSGPLAVKHVGLCTRDCRAKPLIARKRIDPPRWRNSDRPNESRCPSASILIA